MQSELNRPERLESARAAERLAVELGDTAVRAQALNLIGTSLESQGDLDTARSDYAEAAGLARSLRSRKAEALFLNNEGITYGRIGDFESAIQLFERARALARASGAREIELLSVGNLGVSYKNLGAFEKALNAYRELLDDSRTRRQPDREAVALNNLGNLEQLLGRPEEALADHLRALELSRQIGSRENEARSLNTIGHTYYALGKSAQALEYHRQALAIRREIGDLTGQAASLDGAGVALARLGDREQAMANLDESLSIRRRIRDRSGELETLRDRATLERDSGHLDDALSDIRRAVDLEGELRSSLTSPELRGSFGAFQHDKYELFIDMLEQRQREDPGGPHEGNALGVAERGRARVLLESLLEARVDLREGADVELLDRERAVQKQLNTASTQLSRLSTRKGRESQVAAAARDVDDFTFRFEQLKAEIRRRSPRYADVMQPRSLSAAEIQQRVLDDDTVLLEFALGDDRSWLWSVTPDALTSVELPPRRAIDAAARRFYEKVTARQRKPGEDGEAYRKRVGAADGELASAGATLSHLVLGPVADRLNGEWRSKRLAVVATGSLEYVPFAALPLPESAAVTEGARPTSRSSLRKLADDHEIVALPSASVIAVLRQDPIRSPAARHTVAILADPVYEVDDPRVRRADALASANPPSATPSRVAALVGLGRLPFSREEAAAIAALAGSENVLSAVDFKASRGIVTGDALSHYGIVHFATHGTIDSERPALTSLVLSLVDEHGSPQNGYVRIHDIYNMRLDARLVVLSACQTALGKEIKGEGLASLTRAFMYAGVPRVVASLWEVNDFATAEFMKRFYGGVLKRGLRPAAALRAAQIAMSHDPRWSEPFYWAGFVIQGDWR
jgi:CHAT domain-containing protein/tetratricopeptide (TPR) repeat protein